MVGNRNITGLVTFNFFYIVLYKMASLNQNSSKALCSKLTDAEFQKWFEIWIPNILAIFVCLFNFS